MKYDFLIPASLTDGFCGQIAFFRLCLDALGGDAAQARLVGVFGDPETEALAPRWRKYFDRIGVEWAYSEPGEADTYQAQHYRRFKLVRPDCDLAMFCDADVAPMDQFDEMARLLIDRSAIGGVIAHYHFPSEIRKKAKPLADWSMLARKLLDLGLNKKQGKPLADWSILARELLGRELECNYRYTLTPHDQPTEAPFYINYGLLAGPPDVIAEFHACDLEVRERVFALTDSHWGQQISPTFACAAAGLNTVALPMRYNFPNDPQADDLYPEEMKKIVFLHYLRLKHFRRDEIFAEPEPFENFVTSTNLTGSNGIFSRFVFRLTKGEYPFPA